MKAIAALAVLALGALPIPAGAASAGLSCGTVPVRVENATLPLARQVCAAAADAREALSQCGLPLGRPLTVAIRNRGDAGYPHMLAEFDTARNEVRIRPPEELALLVAPGGAFGMLDTDDLFESLLVHELTHASIEEHVGHAGLSLRGVEYVAYALQIASLPRTQQALFLHAHSSDRPVTTDMLAEFILLFDPGVFAARAFRYFASPAGGCESILKALDPHSGFLAPLR